MFKSPGVTLRLVFFPLGTALTSDGQCAVAVLCEAGRGKVEDPGEVS